MDCYRTVNIIGLRCRYRTADPPITTALPPIIVRVLSFDGLLCRLGPVVAVIIGRDIIMGLSCGR